MFVYRMCRVRMYVEIDICVFSQNASPPERALEMMQFEVGMGSTHTILTHSPAFDVPNGKTKAKTIEYKNWRRFFP